VTNFIYIQRPDIDMQFVNKNDYDLLRGFLSAMLTQEDIIVFLEKNQDIRGRSL